MNTIGVVGLGNMGAELARNLVDAGDEVVTYDLKGPGRSPAGATFVSSCAAVAAAADVVVLSLSDGQVSGSVVSELIESSPRRMSCVVDSSTVGIAAAEANAERLRDVAVLFVDAAVSGGPAGARARTLAVMYAGDDAACIAGEPALRNLSDRLYRVGDRPGMAQALKLANNFLSATSLAATSEAISFGQSVGLDMAVMLEVLNASSGQSAATSDKFPTHVLTGRFGSGFANSLMAKDVALYLEEAAARGRSCEIGAAAAAVWRRFVAAEPGADFTRIYPFVDSSKAP